MSGRSLVAAVFMLALSAPPAVFAAQSINWTFYAPGAAGKMQGGMGAAAKGPDGSSVIRTLDDVRTGKSKFVTLASARVMMGRWFCIGTVTYTSPLPPNGDGRTHTLENVVGYVHDTGCAFNGTCSAGWLPQYSTGVQRADKMDIPSGNFTGWGAGPAMQYVTKNKHSAPRTWQQIAGLPTGKPTGTGSACGGEPRETGIGTAPAYRPTSITDAGEQQRIFQQYQVPSSPQAQLPIQPQTPQYPQQPQTPQYLQQPQSMQYAQSPQSAPVTQPGASSGEPGVQLSQGAPTIYGLGGSTPQNQPVPGVARTVPSAYARIVQEALRTASSAERMVPRGTAPQAQRLPSATTSLKRKDIAQPLRLVPVEEPIVRHAEERVPPSAPQGKPAEVPPVHQNVSLKVLSTFVSEDMALSRQVVPQAAQERVSGMQSLLARIADILRGIIAGGIR